MGRRTPTQLSCSSCSYLLRNATERLKSKPPNTSSTLLDWRVRPSVLPFVPRRASLSPSFHGCKIIHASPPISGNIISCPLRGPSINDVLNFSKILDTLPLCQHFTQLIRTVCPQIWQFFNLPPTPRPSMRTSLMDDALYECDAAAKEYHV